MKRCIDCGAQMSKKGQLLFRIFRLPMYCSSCYDKHGDDN